MENIEELKEINTLMDILSSLDPKDYPYLKEVVKCQIFCSSSIYVDKLLSFLMTKPTKINLYKLYIEVYGRKRVSDDLLEKVKNTAAELIKALERFILLRQLDANLIQKSLWLAQWFATKGAAPQFEAMAAECKKNIEKLPEGSLRYQSSFQLQALEWQYSAPDHIKNYAAFEELKQTFCTYQEVVNLTHVCAEGSHQHFLTPTSDDSIKESPQAPILLILHDLKSICETENPDGNQVKCFLDSNIGKIKFIDTNEQIAVRKILVNICAAQGMKGHLDMLQLLPIVINQIATSDPFSDIEFLNCVIGLGMNGQLDAMSNLIDSNITLQNQREAINTAKAYYCFYRAQYREALGNIESIKNCNKFPYKVRYHSLRLRIAYCMEANDLISGTYKNIQVDQVLDSYHKFFTRNGRREVLKNKKQYILLYDFVREMLQVIRKKKELLAQHKFHEAIQGLQQKLKDKGDATPIAYQWVAEQLEILSMS